MELTSIKTAIKERLDEIDNLLIIQNKVYNATVSCLMSTFRGIFTGNLTTK